MSALLRGQSGENTAVVREGRLCALKQWSPTTGQLLPGCTQKIHNVFNFLIHCFIEIHALEEFFLTDKNNTILLLDALDIYVIPKQLIPQTMIGVKTSLELVCKGEKTKW